MVFIPRHWPAIRRFRRVGSGADSLFHGTSLARMAVAAAGMALLMPLSAGAVQASDTLCLMTRADPDAPDGTATGHIPVMVNCLDIGLNGLQSRDFIIDTSMDGHTRVGFRARPGSDPDLPPVVRAHLWRDDGTDLDLGTLGGQMSAALMVTHDGTVAVGQSETERGEMRAFRWSRKSGMQTVEEWLNGTGTAHKVRGWKLQTAIAVSEDGDIIRGYGQDNGEAPQQWIARRGSGLLGLRDMAGSVQANIAVHELALAQYNIFLHGLHGRPSLRRKGPGRYCAWSAGDIGHDGWGARDDLFGLGEMGFCWRPNGDVVASISFGGRWLSRNLPLGGTMRQSGVIGASELQARMGAPLGAPLWLTGTITLGWADARMHRAYLNGGVVDVSSGRTDMWDIGFRGRVEWEGVMKGPGIALTPFAEFSISHSRMDGYREHGGGFPVRFDAMSETVRELRGGLDLDAPISRQLSLHATVEGVHRLEHHGRGMTGEVIGLFAFDSAKRNYERDWLRGSLGLDLRSGPGVLSVSINATTRGEAPSVWGTVGYQVSF